MYGRQNNNYFPQQNVMQIEEKATSSRNNAGGGGGDHRVVRSEVWNRFRLEGLNAICLVCNEKLKVGPTRQTSSLWRHLKRHNRMSSQNQRLASEGCHLVHPQSQLYLQRQQHQQMRTRNTNGFALNGDGIQRQQQKGADLLHTPRGKILHNLRLQQHQQTLCTAPTALLSNFYQNQQHQNYRHLRPFSSSFGCSTTPFNSQQQQSIPSSSFSPDVSLTHPPLVTVDCKPVQNRELDQLLGIHREEGEEEQQEEYEESNISKRGTEQDDGFIMLNQDDGDEEENGEMMEEEEEEEEEEVQNEQLTMGREWALARTLTEFILENGLPFHQLLLFSSTFSSLLRLNQSVPKSLPSPAFLIQRVVPKLFTDTLAERKTHFNDDFFVLVLNRIVLDSPKNTTLLSVTAQKLSDCFSLSSMSLGQFAFDWSCPSGMSDALRQCFEEGPVRLYLWQISAIVHDGSAYSEELCHQLDVPGIPSFHSLMRCIYTELDQLEFPLEIVTRLKKRFKKAINEILNGNSLTDAFSVLALPLIDRIDRFFREEQTAAKNVDGKQEEPSETNDEKKCGNAPIPIHRLEQRLLEKFQLLWAFQRQKLVELETALMALFLNPSNLCATKNAEDREELFGDSKWKETAERVRVQISQACEEVEENSTEKTECEESDVAKITASREDIQFEVTNYMDTARLELGHQPINNTRVNPSSPSPPLAAQFNSLAELLFWWRINAERFPRLVQLARQFCAIPMGNGDHWKEMNEGDDSAEEVKKAMRRYAAELMGKDGDTSRLESGRTEQLQLLTQMTTIRMAVRERTTQTNGTGKGPNECTATKAKAIIDTAHIDESRG